MTERLVSGYYPRRQATLGDSLVRTVSTNRPEPCGGGIVLLGYSGSKAEVGPPLLGIRS